MDGDGVAPDRRLFYYTNRTSILKVALPTTKFSESIIFTFMYLFCYGDGPAGFSSDRTHRILFLRPVRSGPLFRRVLTISTGKKIEVILFKSRNSLLKGRRKRNFEEKKLIFDGPSKTLRCRWSLIARNESRFSASAENGKFISGSFIGSENKQKSLEM